MLYADGNGDGDGAGAVRKYTGRFFPSISDLYSDAGGSKDGIGTEVLLHPSFSQSLPEEVKKKVKDKGGMAGLMRPANPPPLVSKATVVSQEDKDLKVVLLLLFLLSSTYPPISLLIS